MKRVLLLLLAAAPLFAVTVFRVDPQSVMTTAGNAPPGGYPALYAVAGATIQICTDAACTTLATTYTSVAGTTTCPTTAQVVLAGTSLCTPYTGAQGQFGFWLIPGTYYYTVTFPNGRQYGSFPVTSSTAGVDNLAAGPGISLTGSTGSITISNTGVLSFNSRTGAVTPQTGDYNATMVGLGNVTNNAQVVDPGSNGLVARTGTTASSARTITPGSSKVVITNGNGVAGNPTIDGGYTSTDIVNLFTGCSGTQYLGADGACHTAGTFTPPSGSQTQYLQLTPNAGNSTTPRWNSLPIVNDSDYIFSAQTCNASLICSVGGSSGGVLGVGNNVLTLTPVPLGVNGSDLNHPLYVSGGTGTAEGCTINGGGGTSGQSSGQIIINCTNTHSGAWTIQSATSGIVESMGALGSQGGIIQMSPGIFPQYAPITITRDNIFVYGQGGWSPSDLCHPESGGPNCLGPSTLQATGPHWTANPGAYMFTFDGSTQSRKFLINGGLHELDLDGNALAGGHVHLKQVNGTDFFRNHWHDHSTPFSVPQTITPSFYLESGNVSTTGSGGSTCGNTAGFVQLLDFDITSYRVGSGGIQLGTPGTTYDTCSNRMVNGRINIHMVPSAIGLWMPNTDSNELVNVYLGGDNTGTPVTSVLAATATTATITVPNHGLPSTASNVGILLFNSCTIALVSGSCGGSEVRGLEGPVAATYVDASHLSITGAYGLTGAATYYLEKILPIDVSLGGCSNCGGNKFTTLTASLFQEPTGGAGYGNMVTNWNWVNDGNGANPAYQRIGGNWVGHVNAYGFGNFQSVPSYHGSITHTSNGQVSMNFQDLNATASGQQAMRFLYDGGTNITGGGFQIQSLTDVLGFQANLFTLFKTGVFQFQQELPFGSLPAAANCPGCVARVSDSNTVVWGASVAGGGANHIVAWSNTSAWTVLGK